MRFESIQESDRQTAPYGHVRLTSVVALGTESSNGADNRRGHSFGAGTALTEGDAARRALNCYKTTYATSGSLAS